MRCVFRDVSAINDSTGYKMKKTAPLLFTLISLSAQAADFSFTGEIQDITCEVNADFKNLVVILPSVGKGSFANSQTAGHTQFRILLGKCRNVTDFHEDKELYAFFESDHLDRDNNYTLKNVATKDPAHNVNIQLTNADGSAIKVSNNGAQSANFDPIASYRGGDTLSAMKESYTLNYGAQYYATGVVSAGNVETFATFSIRYK